MPYISAATLQKSQRRAFHSSLRIGLNSRVCSRHERLRIWGISRTVTVRSPGRLSRLLRISDANAWRASLVPPASGRDTPIRSLDVDDEAVSVENSSDVHDVGVVDGTCVVKRQE